MQQKTDTELVGAYADSKDESAFEELVNRHKHMVYRTCLRMLRDPHEAEDAAQAVFVVLANKAFQVQRYGNPGAWLHRVAHVVASTALRSRKRRGLRETTFGQDELHMSGNSTEDNTGEIRARLDNALLQLSDVLREAVVLRYLEQLSEKETAQRTGCPLGTIKWRASEGLARLRKIMEKDGLQIGAGAFTGLLEAEAGASVPSTLTTSITAAVKTAAAGSTASGGKVIMLAKSAMKAMFLAKVKTVLVTATAILAIGTSIPVTMAVLNGDTPPASGRSAASNSADSLFVAGIENFTLDLRLGTGKEDLASRTESSGQVIAISAPELNPPLIKGTIGDMLSGVFCRIEEINTEKQPDTAPAIRFAVMKTNEHRGVIIPAPAKSIATIKAETEQTVRSLDLDANCRITNDQLQAMVASFYGEELKRQALTNHLTRFMQAVVNCSKADNARAGLTNELLLTWLNLRGTLQTAAAHSPRKTVHDFLTRDQKRCLRRNDIRKAAGRRNESWKTSGANKSEFGLSTRGSNTGTFTCDSGIWHCEMSWSGSASGLCNWYTNWCDQTLGEVVTLDLEESFKNRQISGDMSFTGVNQGLEHIARLCGGSLRQNNGTSSWSIILPDGRSLKAPEPVELLPPPATPPVSTSTPAKETLE